MLCVPLLKRKRRAHRQVPHRCNIDDEIVLGRCDVDRLLHIDTVDALGGDVSCEWFGEDNASEALVTFNETGLSWSLSAATISLDGG